MRLLDAAQKKAAQLMPLTARTRAAYLRRILKRMDEEKPRLDDLLAGYPEAIVRRMLDDSEDSRAAMLKELDDLAKQRGKIIEN